MYKVDLNSDLGESFGAYTIGMDSEILKYVSSANVACGFHAGDPLVMGKTVELAKAAGTAIGAHPGFPDLVGFGRRNLAASPAEAKADVKYQLGALLAFTKSARARDLRSGCRGGQQHHPARAGQQQDARSGPRGWPEGCQRSIRGPRLP